MSGRGADPAVRSAIIKEDAGQELTPDEYQALLFSTIASIRLFESYHSQHAAGVFDVKDWAAMRGVIKHSFRRPSYRHAFARNDEMWNADFAEEVRSVLREIEAEGSAA